MRMKQITSDENPIYKAAMQLKQKKYRDEQQKYLIEGPNLIQEALRSGGEIEMVIQSEDYSPASFVHENAAADEQAHPDLEAEIAVMSPALFRKLSDTETPQGIMAIVKKKRYTEEEFFAAKPAGDGSGDKNEASNLIVLDRLQDPGNIGTILRTADAAGYMGAILMKGTADVYSPKIARAAAGSLFRVPVLLVDTPEHAIQMLKKYKKKIICTTPNCHSYYYDIDMKNDVAVIIGNEGNGACAEFLDQAELKIKIPMEGTIESLNAAVSAGILMYESVRQRYQDRT